VPRRLYERKASPAFPREERLSPTRAFPSAGGQPAAEFSQAVFESFDEVGVDRWLSFVITARWLGARFLWLVDAERFVQ
jgi:hypothetical protein